MSGRWRSARRARRALGPNHPTVATYRGNLGNVLQALGDLEGAGPQYERMLTVSEAALGPDHPTVAALRDNLNGVLRALQEATPEGPASAV